jgi:hypothetical protein
MTKKTGHRITSNFRSSRLSALGSIGSFSYVSEDGDLETAGATAMVAPASPSASFSLTKADMVKQHKAGEFQVYVVLGGTTIITRRRERERRNKYRYR